MEATRYTAGWDARPADRCRSEGHFRPTDRRGLESRCRPASRCGGVRRTRPVRARSRVRAFARCASAALALSAGAGVAPLAASAQQFPATTVQERGSPSTSALPFGVGEELIYDVTSSRLGRIGEGAMRVEGPEAVRGRPAYRLSFEIDSRVGPVRVRDETRSWLEPEAMRSLRYSKRERHPLARRSEEVEIFPEDRRWVAEGGEAGRSSVDDPLDELSFLYYIRTLDLDDDAEYVIERHFDPARNPVVVRVLGRERASLPSGFFDIIVVEMEVRDGERFEDTGLLRLYLTDDGARYPVRIVTSVPLAGELVLDLKALTPGVALAGARDAGRTRL